MIYVVIADELVALNLVTLLWCLIFLKNVRVNSLGFSNGHKSVLSFFHGNILLKVWSYDCKCKLKVYLLKYTLSQGST